VDLILGDFDGCLYFFENTESGWLLDDSIFGGIDFTYAMAPSLCDLDSDGDLDLTVGDLYGNFRYFKNKTYDHKQGTSSQ